MFVKKMNLIACAAMFMFTHAADAFTMPCIPGGAVRSCPDLCNPWKKFYPVKQNIGACVKGCMAAHKTLSDQYTRSLPSLDIKGIKCSTFWTHLGNIGSGAYIKKAIVDGCFKVQSHTKACMKHQEINFPEKFEPDNDGADDDDSDDSDEETKEAPEEAGTASDAGSPDEPIPQTADGEAKSHQSMQDQLASFKK
jgi:hypothetical protein